MHSLYRVRVRFLSRDSSACYPPNACSSMTSNRHVYEVITEGATCKLYFDVEFKLKCNPGVIGVEVLEVFVQYVCYLVGSCFGLAVNRTHVLDLDSRCVWWDVWGRDGTVTECDIVRMWG